MGDPTSLPLPYPFEPMEARAVGAVPSGDGWQLEPKWDGFRCLAWRDGDEVWLQSKGLKPLGRYFPEVVRGLLALPARRFVLDGELVIPAEGALSFEALQLRLHPAESRVRKLAAESPALLVAFDLLVDEDGRRRTDDPLDERRAALEDLARRAFDPASVARLSPATHDAAEGARWFAQVGGGLDGLMAKRRDAPYHPGERDVVLKVKHDWTADCVVAGFRYAKGGRVLGSLLLGLYGEDGRLHHVGFTATIPSGERRALTRSLEALRDLARAEGRELGFSGNAPGGPSRWSTERSGQWEPLPPEAVLEVAYDHFSGGRFRHGTRLVRWRPDKAPRQCTFAQVHRSGEGALTLAG